MDTWTRKNYQPHCRWHEYWKLRLSEVILGPSIERCSLRFKLSDPIQISTFMFLPLCFLFNSFSQSFIQWIIYLSIHSLKHNNTNTLANFNFPFLCPSIYNFPYQSEAQSLFFQGHLGGLPSWMGALTHVSQSRRNTAFSRQATRSVCACQTRNCIFSLGSAPWSGDPLNIGPWWVVFQWS